MTMERVLTIRPHAVAVSSIIGCAAALGVFALTAFAAAQERRPAAPQTAVQEEPDLFDSIGRWFDRQADSISSSFKDAGRNIDTFGTEAGIAARTTADGVNDAAGVVARLPKTRVVSGHATCRVAANGAPDCVSAADAVCRTKGFVSGKSLDMTTAEICPPKIWMAGRNEGEGCRTETFVSRALCQ